jgi:hypothetical protein
MTNPHPLLRVVREGVRRGEIVKREF